MEPTLLFGQPHKLAALDQHRKHEADRIEIELSRSGPGFDVGQDKRQTDSTKGEAVKFSRLTSSLIGKLNIRTHFSPLLWGAMKCPYQIPSSLHCRIGTINGSFRFKGQLVCRTQKLTPVSKEGHHLRPGYVARMIEPGFNDEIWIVMETECGQSPLINQLPESETSGIQADAWYRICS